MADIDYGSIVKRSWDITRNNKWLWVYGLVLAVLGGNYNSSGNSGSSSASSHTSTKQLQNIPEKLPETQKVLGAATNAIIQWIQNIPPATWLAIALIVIFIIIIWSVVSWVARSWARTGLILGVADAADDKPVDLISTSPRTFPLLKNIMLYDLICLGLTGGAIIVSITALLLCVIIARMIPVIGILVAVLTGFILIFGIILTMLMLSIASVYTERLIVLRRTGPWTAWKKGLTLARKHAIPTVVMGLINNVIGCGTGCLSALILFAVFIPLLILVFASGLFSGTGFNIQIFIQLLPQLICLGLPAFILGISFQYLISALFTVFRYSTWNLFFREINQDLEAQK
jgi:hypothetical protein